MARAAGRSSAASPLEKPIVKALTGRSLSAAMRARIEALSMPPERNMP